MDLHAASRTTSACSFAALVLCLAALAYTSGAGATCPFAIQLGDQGGYNKDVLEIQALHPSTSEAKSPAPITDWSPPSSCNSSEFRAIAADILTGLQAQIAAQPGGLEPPTTARAAFHSAGTAKATAGPTALGGPNGGWIQFDKELSFPENAGLEGVVDYLKDVKKQHPCITFADIVTFAGAIATEAAGGPPIAWIPGRLDTLQPPSGLPLSIALPDGSFTASAVLAYFTNMGLSARDTVALIGGGHSFGAASFKNSGWNGAFTPNGSIWPQEAKNQYFVHLTTLDWQPQVVEFVHQRLQFIPRGRPDLVGPGGSPIIRLPSDIALLTAGGAFTHWVMVYAEDEKLFLQDFARVFQRVMQLGAVPGAPWKLHPQQFVWLGINSTATNYGIDIQPLNSSYTVSVASAVPKNLKAAGCSLENMPSTALALPTGSSSSTSGAGTLPSSLVALQWFSLAAVAAVLW